MRYDQLRPLVKPAALYLEVEELFSGLKPYPSLQLNQQPEEGRGGISADITPLPPIQVQPQKERPLSALCEFIDDYSGRVVLIAESEGRREALLELLSGAELHPKLCQSMQDVLTCKSPLMLLVASIEQGFTLGEYQLAVISENELLGERVTQSRRRKSQKTSSSDIAIRNLAELTQGQAVVHLDHGVGRYLGLQTLDAGTLPAEYMALEYAGGINSMFRSPLCILSADTVAPKTRH